MFKLSNSSKQRREGVDSLLGSLGGMLFLNYGQETVQGSVSTGRHTGGGNIDITINVLPGQDIRLSMFNIGKNFPISAQYSQILIREID